jgi:predicted metal-dependent hydrolase
MPEGVIWRVSTGKHLRITVRTDGTVILSVPKRASKVVAERFLASQEEWIAKARARIGKRERLPSTDGVTQKQERKLALARIQERIAYFNREKRFPVRRVAIRDQRTRWGSCSHSGTLSFQYRLVRLPLPVLDYVVVHELCHLEHMNHGPAFWRAVGSILPDYERLRRELNNYQLDLPID